MAKRKTYHPYKVHPREIRKFRGVVNGRNPLTIDRAYVPWCNGINSFRIGEFNPADVAAFNSIFEGSVDSGEVVENKWFVLSTGTDMWLNETEYTYSSLPNTRIENSEIPTAVIPSDGPSYKTYMRRVFGGRQAEWRGIDQGKNKLYRGAVVHDSNDLLYSENSLAPHEVVAVSQVFEGAIDSGTMAQDLTVVSSGTEVWIL